MIHNLVQLHSQGDRHEAHLAALINLKNYEAVPVTEI